MYKGAFCTPAEMSKFSMGGAKWCLDHCSSYVFSKDRALKSHCQGIHVHARMHAAFSLQGAACLSKNLTRTSYSFCSCTLSSLICGCCSEKVPEALSHLRHGYQRTMQSTGMLTYRRLCISSCLQRFWSGACMGVPWSLGQAVSDPRKRGI